MGSVLGKWGSGILTRLTGNARELLPAGAPRIFGVFLLFREVWRGIRLLELRSNVVGNRRFPPQTPPS